jgi:hypothetical protein
LKKIKALNSLYESLEALSSSSPGQYSAAIDDTLLRYLESAIKGKYNTINELAPVSWAQLVRDSDVDLVKFPAFATILNSQTALLSKNASNPSPSPSPSPSPGAGSSSAALDPLLSFPPEDRASLSIIAEAGFDLNDAYAALIACDKDPSAAIQMILDGNLPEDRKTDFTSEPSKAAATFSDSLSSSTANSTNSTNSAPADTAPSLASSAILISRFDFIKEININFSKCLELVDLTKLSAKQQGHSIAHLISRYRNYFLSVTKLELFSGALLRTQSSSGSEVEVIISRSRASKFADRGECDLEGRWSIFGQMFRALHGYPPSSWRRSGQLWKILFAGERGQDAGGLYRECWAAVCQELMSKSVPLLVPCPNGKSIVGSNRETWILNPDSTSSEQMQMFEFLGKLMGIAVRTEIFMEVTLAPIVWKAILDETITIEDYRGIDSLSVSFIEKLRREKSKERFIAYYESLDLCFSTTSLGGSNVELHCGGESSPVTWENREIFCEELLQYRLSELSQVASAVRTGLSTQIPAIMLKLMRWDELEYKVLTALNLQYPKQRFFGI